MKKAYILFTIVVLIVCKLSYGDIINTGYHAVNKCYRITNIDNYPEISLLAYTEGTLNYPTYEVGNNKCLEYGYRFSTISIYAVPKSYLIGKDITTLDLPNDKNAIKSNTKFTFERVLVKDSNTVNEIDHFFKIVGFTTDSLILFKYKEEQVRGNGFRDPAINFEYDGDTSKISQQFPVGLLSSNNSSMIEVDPNRMKKSINVKISNGYKGKIKVKIVSSEGILKRTLFLYKTKAVLDYEIPIKNLPKGEYLANFEFSQQVETKRFMVE